MRTARFPAWLRAREAVWARRPTLEEALLGRRFGRYAWHRLQGFAAVRLLATLVHLVELALVREVLPPGWLTTGIVAINVCGLLGAFWWGALEVLRARLRAEPTKAARAVELARWLARAVALATLVLVILALGLASAGAPTAAAAYVAVCVARLAADVVLRTLYSAVYATRRVHRPMLSLVAAELLALGIVAVAAGSLGGWVLPLGVGAATLVSRTLTLVYTRRAYRALRLPWVRPRLGVALDGREPVRVLLAGLANLSTRLAPAAVLILLAGGERGVALSVHAMAPLLIAASLWPQVFYLDMVHLLPEAAGALRRRLERRLLGLALPAGALAFGVAVAVAAAVGLPAHTRLAVALAPVFLAQSLLGALQVTSFARGRFAGLAASGVTLGVAVAALGPLGGLVAAAVVLQLAALLARRPPRPRHDTLAGWLDELRAVAGPVTAAVAVLPGAAPRQLRALADAVAAALGDPRAVVAHGARVFWIERDRALAGGELAALGGGLVAGVERHRGATGVLAAAAITVPVPPSPPPGAIVVSVARGHAGPVPPAELADAWRVALAGTRGARRRRAAAHEVHVTVDGGEITTLILVPRSTIRP